MRVRRRDGGNQDVRYQDGGDQDRGDQNGGHQDGMSLSFSLSALKAGHSTMYSI